MLVLKYKGATTIPLEAECLTPNHLAGKSVAEIAALPLQHGNVQAPLGEFFTISGDAADQEIVIEGDCSRVKAIGAGMTSGKILVHGDVGMHLGAKMRGGEITVRGRAGDWAGAEMHGGRIDIQGDAGRSVGGAYPGSAVGMRGGTILVSGNAGGDVGHNMRRGFIAIGGDAGDFVGSSLIAGSIFLFGRPGLHPGAGMKRGSIVFLGDRPNLLPTFRYDCVYQPVFLKIYLRQLKTWGFAVPDETLHGAYERYSGDLLALGKGELLYWRRS